MHKLVFVYDVLVVLLWRERVCMAWHVTKEGRTGRFLKVYLERTSCTVMHV